MSEIKETPEPQEGKSAQEDLDMAKIQESMKGLRQQQARELQEDLDKFNNRPKPAYYEASSKREGQPDAALISEGQKKENPGSGNLDMVQVEAAMKGNDLNWTPQDGTAEPPPEHTPKSAFGEEGDAERTESGAEKTEKEHFSGYGRNPERGG